MMTTIDPTKALELATLWWVPCEYCAGSRQRHDYDHGSQYPCDVCCGTGKFYPLRKPCSASEGGRHVDPFIGDNYECASCDQRNWLPNVTLETMLGAANQYDVHFYRPDTVCLVNYKNRKEQGVGHSENETEALLNAMLQIVKEGKR